ncbi:hypothetical protein QBC45DRAFT_437408 [Copromyces sp. CBS 386.78]|nr:hypothetical protein QBC45DRAFT_437408 [Copromyces sp. CBS 386.78]
MNGMLGSAGSGRNGCLHDFIVNLYLLPVVVSLLVPSFLPMPLFHPYNLEGERGDWEKYLPPRAQMLACCMANASNALPEQFIGALRRLHRLHLAEVNAAEFDGSADSPISFKLPSLITALGTLWTMF